MKRAWLAIVLGALLGSCGETRSDGGSGSNTNWLHCTSDGDCPSGAECWCNTCSASCTRASDCRGSSCAAANEYGCGEPPKSAELCILRCESGADCAPQGNNLSCVNGACLAGASNEGGDGGGGDSTLEPAPQSGAGGAGAETGDNGGEAGSGGSDGGDVPPADPPLDDGALRPLALAAGFGCLIHDGRVYCWGNNDAGQLGTATDMGGRLSPSEVPGIADARSVAVSRRHACALTANGDVYCWGSNDQGQLGESSAPLEECSAGTVVCRPTPARVENLGRALELAVVEGRSCARLEHGEVSCWGELGDAISDWAATVRDATSLALGAAGACAILGDGSLSCSFGLPQSAESWRGLRRIALVAELESASSAGFGCALGMLDDVLCFGDDSMAQLGASGAGTGAAALNGGVRAVSLGAMHACALKETGEVQCWGRNHGGALGAPPYAVPVCGPYHCTRTPLTVEGLPEVTAVASEVDQNCALAKDGTLWCWGIGTAGFGATRQPGPWEAGDASCSDALGPLTERRYDGTFQLDTDCDVAEDCADFPLDLPCSHTCASISASVDGEANQRLWAGIVAACPAESAGCTSPAVSCAVPERQPFCNNGSCDRYDPVRSGCDDPCVCDVARFPNRGFRDECAGFDLQIFYVGNCSTCDRVGLHVALTNRGSTTFSGDLRLSFDDGDPVPAPMTTHVTVSPGEVTMPFVFQTDGVGGGQESFVRVTAAGDCNPDNDATWQGLIPKTSAVCEAER